MKNEFDSGQAWSDGVISIVASFLTRYPEVQVEKFLAISDITHTKTKVKHPQLR
ncbi:MAG: hypothetical protein H6715_05270 [Myxococcales bacterium]|nr:hypothetical protein [Myxococcales bacterium]MCB9709236.1 hypothetical protein [Myxococcales bacterium]